MRLLDLIGRLLYTPTSYCKACREPIGKTHGDASSAALLAERDALREALLGAERQHPNEAVPLCMARDRATGELGGED